MTPLCCSEWAADNWKSQDYWIESDWPRHTVSWLVSLVSEVWNLKELLLWNIWWWVSWCCRNIFLPSDQLLAQLDVGRSRFSWPGPDSISSALLSDRNQVPSPQRPLLWSSRLQCRDLGGRKFSVNSANSVNSDIHLRDICPSDWGEGFNSSTLWRHHIHMGWHFYPKIWPI